MDLYELKSAYSDAGNAGKQQMSKAKLQRMTRINNHPVLKRIKIQLIFESILWIGFLMVYYDVFDGHLKPLIWNVLLILGVVLLLVHNLLGYQITKNPVNAENIMRSLNNYLKRIKLYSIISICTRVLAIVLIFGYFLSAIATYETKHYWSIGFILLLIAVQIYLLRKVWSRRIKTISKVSKQLKSD